MTNITIKELHAKTGEQVRRAGNSRKPIGITDRGKLIAVLIAPRFLQATKRHRILLPEYAKLMAKKPTDDVLEDLDAIRGDS